MGKQSITSKVETITPKKAQIYLESNTNNRRVRQTTVDFYARIMSSGAWKLNGKTIVISNEGVILDGQHRLQACVNSGATFQTVVVRGPEDECFGTIDQGVVRTGGDIVGREGYSQSNRKSAATRVILAIDEVDGGIEGFKPNLGLKRAHIEILDYVVENDDLLTEACNAVREDDGPSICKPPAVFVALYVFLAQKNRTKAKEFFEQLTSGENLNKSDPTYKLRKTLVGALSVTGVRRKKTWVLAITIKAWNAFLQGSTVGQLKFSETEKWPKTRARR